MILSFVFITSGILTGYCVRSLEYKSYLEKKIWRSSTIREFQGRRREGKSRDAVRVWLRLSCRLRQWPACLGYFVYLSSFCN